MSIREILRYVATRPKTGEKKRRPTSLRMTPPWFAVK
jgi:hypothetical protein